MNTFFRFFGVLLVVPIFFLGCGRTHSPGLPPVPENSKGKNISGDDTAKANQSPSAASVSEEAKKRHALLVGCTTYDNHPTRNLEGPGNDVVLLRQVLKERFGFADQNMVTLSEAAAKKNGEKHRPMRANIQREFAELANKAQVGDQVVILLAGHGSQQPDQEPFDEVDGLDETFLPADIGRWDGSNNGITNAIIDDELGDWVKKIAAKKAYVWMIVDSCHSGTMLRGDVDVRREVDPTNDLGVPVNALLKARQEAAKREKTRGGGQEEKSFDPFDLTGLVALYAAQSHEPTVERPMPPDGVNQQRYGLFTYTLCQILTQATRPLTYRELDQRIHAQYVQWGRNSPTPLVEGAEQDREVLGRNKIPPSHFILVKDVDFGWKMTGGKLHGLNTGSIMAVFPPPGTKEDDKVMGHVKVANSRIADSLVEACAFGKTPVPKNLQPGNPCKPVSLDYGDLRVQVAVDNYPKERRPALDALEETLHKLAKEPGAVFEVVKGIAKAKWVVQSEGTKILLLPADVAQIEDPKKRPAGAFRLELPEKEAADTLKAYLGRISRAQNMLALAGTSTEVMSRDASAINVEVKMLKLKDQKDPEGTPIRWETRGTVLTHGDWVAWKVTNNSRVAVDVSLLFVDSGYGIDPWFPRPKTTSDNRLLPGKTLELVWTKAQVNAKKSAGQEHMVVIAVEAEGPPVDFTCLAQPTFKAAKEVLDLDKQRGPESSKRTLDSPFGKLFQNALFAQGTTRALNRAAVDQHQLHLLSWRVAPVKTETK